MYNDDDADADGRRESVADRIEAAQHSKTAALSLAGLGLIAVPEPVHRMAWLRELDLSGNRIERLPRWLCKLTDLRVLDVSGNQLAELPDWIGLLDNLRTLRARRNRLTTLPAALTDLTSLSILDLRDNDLVELPSALSRLSLRELLVTGNPHLAAEGDEPPGRNEIPVDLGNLRSGGAGDSRPEPKSEPEPESESESESESEHSTAVALKARDIRRTQASKRRSAVRAGAGGAVAIAVGVVLVTWIPAARAHQDGSDAASVAAGGPGGGSSPGATPAAVPGSGSATSSTRQPSPGPGRPSGTVLAASASPAAASMIVLPGGATTPVGVVASGGAPQVLPTTSAPAAGSPYPAISATFNDVGITEDGATAAGNYDGSGDASFSEQALTAGGASPGASISSDGFVFVFPDVPAGEDDNTVTEGQDISVTGSGTSLGFLLSASFGPAEGSGRIYYTDGTVQSYQLDSPDWFNDYAPPDGAVAVSSAYQDRMDDTTYPKTGDVFAQSIPLDAGKTIAYVQLPDLGPLTDGDKALHIFDVELS